MRNLFLIFLSGVLLTSCVSSHGGAITSSVALNQDNFFIEESVSGSATATYILGFGGNDQIALVAQAKRDLLNKTNFSLGSRALANEVLDFKIQNILGVVTKVTATVTAQVVNFDLSQKPDSNSNDSILLATNEGNHDQENDEGSVLQEQSELEEVNIVNQNNQALVVQTTESSLIDSVLLTRSYLTKTFSSTSKYLTFLDNEYQHLFDFLVTERGLRKRDAGKLLLLISDSNRVKTFLLEDVSRMWNGFLEKNDELCFLLRELMIHEESYLSNQQD